jgi:hypothetical protein
MFMRFMLSVACLGAILALSACQPGATPNAEAPVIETLADGTMQAVVDLTTIEDAGYPMFRVNAKAADGQELSLLLNNEDEKVDLFGLEPAALAGKKATMTYVSEAELDLLELTAAGKPLIMRAKGETAPDLAGAKTVTGKLSGADEKTAGDLPSEMTVTDASGKAFAFRHFITEDAITKANGQEVTAAFAENTQLYVRTLKLAD